MAVHPIQTRRSGAFLSESSGPESKSLADDVTDRIGPSGAGGDGATTRVAGVVEVADGVDRGHGGY